MSKKAIKKKVEATPAVACSIAMVEKPNGKGLRAYCSITGSDLTPAITYMTLSKAYKAGAWLTNSSGKWRQIAPYTPSLGNLQPQGESSDAATKVTHQEEIIMQQLHSCVQKRPSTLICQDLTWRHICRGILRGRNVLLTGPTGCGKSQTALAAAKALDREIFYINLGATQDPRGALIGNTHFSKDSGTYFNESAFVKAIQTENQVILLDELSRAHPEAWNILMTVLDPEQRYLRLDEAVNTPIIHVAAGVSFIATANIGSEYTAVRVMDRALLDRFINAEIPWLTAEQEAGLITSLFPSLPGDIVKNLSLIAEGTRSETITENSKISTPLSTRSILEIAGMMVDGFSMSECAEVSIYPLYSMDGGLLSERTFMKQLVQKHINDGTADNLMSN